LNTLTPEDQPAPCCCHSEHFTERELDVLSLVAAANQEIATALNITGNTVAGHLRAMLRRSHARNRAELVARAFAAGILTTATWPPHPSGRRCLQLPASPDNAS
jgi:DNA-binding NarL/FixJ family response regulator